MCGLEVCVREGENYCVDMLPVLCFVVRAMHTRLSRRIRYVMLVTLLKLWSCQGLQFLRSLSSFGLHSRSSRKRWDPENTPHNTTHSPTLHPKMPRFKLHHTPMTLPVHLHHSPWHMTQSLSTIPHPMMLCVCLYRRGRVLRAAVGFQEKALSLMRLNMLWLTKGRNCRKQHSVFMTPMMRIQHWM